MFFYKNLIILQKIFQNAVIFSLTSNMQLSWRFKRIRSQILNNVIRRNTSLRVDKYVGLLRLTCTWTCTLHCTASSGIKCENRSRERMGPRATEWSKRLFPCGKQSHPSVLQDT